VGKSGGWWDFFFFFSFSLSLFIFSFAQVDSFGEGVTHRYRLGLALRHQLRLWLQPVRNFYAASCDPQKNPQGNTFQLKEISERATDLVSPCFT
jgi:hypothetical protein